MKLLIFLSLCYLGVSSICSDITDPDRCVAHTSLGIHTCVFCGTDQQCHDVGSLYDPCSDSCCASNSDVSTCEWKKPTDIPGSCIATPEQIHLAFGGVSEAGNPNAIVVNWFTMSKTASSTVMYGTSRDSLTRTATSNVPAVNYLSNHGYHHSVILSPLDPKTMYFYKAGDSDGGFSDVLNFTTMSDDAETGYSVAVFGDMGYLGSKERPLVIPAVDGLVKNWSAVPTHDLLVRLHEAQKIDYMLLVGDISYADDSFATDLAFSYEKVYNGYMNWMESLASNMPFMVVPGNHESECHSPICVAEKKYHSALQNFTAYNARWSMPSRSSGGVLNMWYSYNLGPVHWVGLNCETDFDGAGEETHGDSGFFPAGSFASNGTYLKWLEADLIKANEERRIRPWIIATGHRPMREKVGLALNGLLVKYGVDLYLAGHQHSYTRSGPTNLEGGIDKSSMLSFNHYHQAISTTYIVVGGAGCDEMDYVADPKTGVYHAVPHLHNRSEFMDPRIAVKNISSDKVSAGVLTIYNASCLGFELLEGTTSKVLDHVFITK